MNNLHPDERIVATGTFLYAGELECDVRIVFSPIRYGTGDDDDLPEVADDVMIDTYYIQYRSTSQRGVFNAGGGGFPSLSEARLAAEAAPGIGGSIRWHERT